jgi:hypothetical protein
MKLTNNLTFLRLYLFSFSYISERDRNRCTFKIVVDRVRVAAVIDQGQGRVEGLPDLTDGPVEPRAGQRRLVVTQVVSVQRGRAHQAQQNAAWWFWITNCFYRTGQINRSGF